MTLVGVTCQIKALKMAAVMLPFTHPIFRELYAPIDGRVLNLSVHVKL